MPVNYCLRPRHDRHFGGHNCVSAYGWVMGEQTDLILAELTIHILAMKYQLVSFMHKLPLLLIQ